MIRIFQVGYNIPIEYDNIEWDEPTVGWLECENEKIIAHYPYSIIRLIEEDKE